MKKPFLFLMVIAICLQGLAGVASAHDPTPFYPVMMVDRTQDWRFTQTFPLGDWRLRVRDGLNYKSADGTKSNWNSMDARPIAWTERAQVADFDPLACPLTLPGFNAIHSRLIDGRDGILALVLQCYDDPDYPTSLASAQMVFDVPSEDWYVGTGDALYQDGPFGIGCGGRCQIDVWSIATHEWGHMTGWHGHFSTKDSELCKNDGTYHTMCEKYDKGTERQRTLEPHDRHTYTNAYGRAPLPCPLGPCHPGP